MSREAGGFSSSSAAGVFRVPDGYLIRDLSIRRLASGQAVALGMSSVPTISSPPAADKGINTGMVIVGVHSSPVDLDWYGLCPGIETLAWSGASGGILISFVMERCKK